MGYSHSLRNYDAFKFSEVTHSRLLNICEDLLRCTPIKVFGYREFYLDGKYIALCTNLEYQKCYFENITDLGTGFFDAFSKTPLNQILYYLWQNNPNLDDIFNTLFYHNIWNGITLCKRTRDRIAIFAFAGTRDSLYLPNYYINHLDVLKEYINYLSPRINDMIKSTSISPFATFRNFKKFEFPDSNKKLAYNHNSFNCGNQFILSNRQYQCVELIAKGYSYKKIGQILQISHKTVETHVETLMHKYSLTGKDKVAECYHLGKFRKK